jgi:branched-chain amino acid transport system substrate-binding protein
MKKTILLLILISMLLPAALFAQTAEPIRVGVFLDITGATSIFGIPSRNGIKLAVDEINAAGGINGRRLKIFLEDNQGRPETSKEVAAKLINENKVHAILGDVASSNSLAVAPLVQEAEIPMITHASTNPRVTAVGDYIFRTCFIDPFQGEAMAKFAFNELKARRVAIFSDINSDYSKGLTENFSQTFTQLGGKIVAKELYVQSDNDFKAQLYKIKSRKPDAVYLPGYFGQTGIIAKQARRLKMLMPLLGGDGWDAPELWKLGGYALNNSYITNHFAVDNPSPGVQDFIKKYEAEFNEKPDSLAALAYDSVYVLADALRRAGTTDGDLLRDTIAQTKNISGVSGKIVQIDKNRNAVKPVYILKLNPKASQFVYNSTVEP